MEIDARSFDRRARTVFRPIYPVIAEQILDHTGVRRGMCLDIGCGPGYLGIELARKSDLGLCFLDQSADMLEILAENLLENEMTGRARTILADAEDIPLPDESVDLAVSRGSVFFWDDHVAAFGEIHRVLTPGGLTFIGGGFGSSALKEHIGRKLKASKKGDGEWRDLVKRNMGPGMRKKFEQALQQAGVTDYDVIQNPEVGMWIVMRKAS